MNDLVTHTVTIFLGFLAMMNPLANTAIFVSLTDEYDKSEQIRIAARSLIIAFCIVVLFALLGKGIFQLFGITLPALRIAGGILVFMIGYHMLHGERSSLNKPHGNDSSDIAVSPLAVPLLAGPGTIATAMNFAAAGGWGEIIATILMFAALCVVTFVFFISGQRLVALIGASGLAIVNRLMGLILAIIGVQMAIAGVLAIAASM
ncbi:MarC family protein [Marinobacter sp. 1Y8]